MTNNENEKLQVLTDEELVQVAGGVSDGDILYDTSCAACESKVSGRGIDQFTLEGQNMEVQLL